METNENGLSATAGTRIAIVILGMHRAGGSALTGVLTRLGCDAPASRMPPDDDNTDGPDESGPISNLNDLILATAGTSWDDWSGVAPAWYESPRHGSFAERALELVRSEFDASPLIVLSDPRISILAPFWFDVLARAGYTVRVVFSCRAAAEVAASLAERDGFDPALGQLIWLRYVLESEYASREMPRIFVGHDRLMADWRAEVGRIEDIHALRLPRQSPRAIEDVDVFLTPSMRHHASRAGCPTEDPPTSPWIADAHAVLEHWMSTGEDSDGRQTLDRVRTEFDAVSPTFDRLVQLARGRPKAEAALMRKIGDANAGRAAAEARADRFAEEARSTRSAAEEAEIRIAALETDLATHVSMNVALEDGCAEQAEELERRADALLALELKTEELETALAELSRLQINLQDEFHTAEEAARNRQREDEAALACANAEIKRIENSRSIRMMAPLRRLKALFK